MGKYVDNRTAADRFEYNKAYRASNRDQLATTKAAWQRRPDVAKRMSDKQKAKRQADPEKLRAWDRTWLVARKMRSLGSSVIQYLACVHFQGDRCSICRRPFDETRARFNPRIIEHCHKTMTFRGVVCHGCNVILGMARDNPVTLQGAIAYLERAEFNRSVP